MVLELALACVELGLIRGHLLHAAHGSLLLHLGPLDALFLGGFFDQLLELRIVRLSIGRYILHFVLLVALHHLFRSGWQFIFAVHLEDLAYFDSF